MPTSLPFVVQLTYTGCMSERTLRADLDVLADVERLEGLEVASLTRYDIPALAALHVVAYDEPPTAENLWESAEEMRMCFEGAFGEPLDHSFIGAWDDGLLVGAILCVAQSPWDDFPTGPCVIDLMVDPEYRRRGIATGLVAELARRATEWGWGSLTLRVGPRHGAAAKLYELLGFTEVPA